MNPTGIPAQPPSSRPPPLRATTAAQPDAKVVTPEPGKEAGPKVIEDTPKEVLDKLEFKVITPAES